MKFYICSGTSLVAQCEALAGELQGAGHVVTSRWHSGLLGNPRLELADPALKDRAVNDLRDIYKANILIVITKNGGRGGRHFEAGVAYALNRQVWLVGEPEHAFHLLADRRFTNVNALLSYIKRLPVDSIEQKVLAEIRKSGGGTLTELAAALDMEPLDVYDVCVLLIHKGQITKKDLYEA